MFVSAHEVQSDWFVVSPGKRASASNSEFNQHDQTKGLVRQARRPPEGERERTSVRDRSTDKGNAAWRIKTESDWVI